MVRPRPREQGNLSHLGELSSTFEKKHYEKLCIMFHYKLASFLTNFRKLPPLNFFNWKNFFKWEGGLVYA